MFMSANYMRISDANWRDEASHRGEWRPAAADRSGRVPLALGRTVAAGLLLWVCFSGCGAPPAEEAVLNSPVAVERTGDASDVVNLAGVPTDPFAVGAPKAIVLVFISNDCPIANRYAPEIRRLRATFDPLGVRFWLVHAAADESPQSIRRHAEEYQLDAPILRDPRQVLVGRAGVRVTPEAAVFTPEGDLRYVGRIDDRFVELGRERPAPTSHDLEQALTDLLAGRRGSTNRVPAVGCFIPKLP
jgi:hypothetical protein